MAQKKLGRLGQLLTPLPLLPIKAAQTYNTPELHRDLCVHLTELPTTSR